MLEHYTRIEVLEKLEAGPKALNRKKQAAFLVRFHELFFSTLQTLKPSTTRCWCGPRTERLDNQTRRDAVKARLYLALQQPPPLVFHVNRASSRPKFKMVSKKSSRPPASKISSAASPAVSSQTQSVQKSAVIRSAFSPSEFQLALFASVIHGLESQHLRIHDTNTGRLRFDHAIGSKASINSLDWGHFGRKGSDHDEQPHKKKRKRNEQVNGIVPAEEVQDVVVALGTSDSDIQMFSPTENKIVGILRGGHDRGVRDFKFTRQAPCTEGWSIGGDGKLVQWDLRRSRSIRYFLITTLNVSIDTHELLGQLISQIHLFLP
jgi:hypothetical protein